MGPETESLRGPRRPWLVDALVAFYLALTALLSLTLPDPGYLPAVHLGLIATIPAIRRWAPFWFHQLYSALLVPLLYMELDTLSGLAGGQTYDHVVTAWEKRLFGDPMPAEWLSRELPYLLFSEVLHFCYLSYYPMLFFLALRMYWIGHKRLQAFLWSCHLATFSIYLIQMWFPVQGPRPLMPPLDESLHGPFWRLCHYLCGQGASGAAAFPSGHVTFAVAVTVSAWLWDSKTYRFLLALTIGMAVATVYGRFHYVVDVWAGSLIAYLTLDYAPRLHRALSNRLERAV